MRRSWINFLLFVLTFVSTWVKGGPGYSVPIMLILLGHELAHYFMSRKHDIRATLPYFLPFPVSPFGTLGAVIRMESIVPSRKALFDTGVAGPLASLCLSIPAIVIGLILSRFIPAGVHEAGAVSAPFLFSLIAYLIKGDTPKNYSLFLHPIAYAGWVGLFVTALNLLPIGQLDGGHIVYALFGRRSRIIYLLATAGMAFITVFYNPGWLLLLILFIIFGFRHPTPVDDFTPLDARRKLIGGFVFLIFFLSFTPDPFPELVKELKEAFPWF